MALNSIIERIDERRVPLNLTDRALSIRAGLSGDAMRNLRRRVDDPGAGASQRSLEGLAAALGVSVAWLSTGQDDGSSSEPAVVRNPSQKTIDDLRHIRCYDIDAAAGNGAVVGIEQALFEIGFSPSMLREITNAPLDALAFVRVRGDSMIPTLVNGDWMMVDTTKREVALGGMFLLRDGETLMVKRVEPLPLSGHILVKSDNPLVPAFEAGPDQIEIMGRVVWIGRRI